MDAQVLSHEPDLLLSTWFFLYLHPDRSVGGLPNEFLTEGSSALLLFDSIGCDRNALAWEKRFSGSWLSSDLYSALEDEGILQPIDLGKIAASALLPHLRNTGVSQAALRLMHMELEAIKGGRRPPERLSIPPALKELNKGMFAALGIEMPRTVLYPGRENYFKNSQKKFRSFQGAAIPIKTNALAEQRRRFLSAMRALIPEFTLLPRIQAGSESAAALRRNMLREKTIVLRYAYGDPEVSPDDITEYRLGSTFRDDDKKTDGPRRKAAEKNLKLLLRVRRQTADVRGSVHQVISDIMAGTRSVSEVKKELNEAQRALASYLPQPQLLKFDLRLAGTAAAAAALEGAATLAGVHMLGVPSLVISTYEFIRQRSEMAHATSLRQQYPLAVLVSEVDRAKSAAVD